ncbi:uncharacterized protein DS421_14g467260 [Arachis hypogaea]|nr:uncharacterized protein DS421_14g467260 [Arachis hypogaea]
MAATPLAAGIGLSSDKCTSKLRIVVEPPELFAATGLLSGRFGIATVPLCYFGNVGSSPDYCMLRLVSLWLLRMWLEAEVAVVDDFG